MDGDNEDDYDDDNDNMADNEDDYNDDNDNMASQAPPYCLPSVEWG